MNRLKLEGEAIKLFREDIKRKARLAKFPLFSKDSALNRDRKHELVRKNI